jgi:YhcH/YjgK/YiaL family protein
MIIDDLTQASKYVSIHPRFEKAFEYLTTTDFANLKPGKYEIDGTNIYAMVVNDAAVAMLDSTAEFECHNTYIDIQYVFGGIETVGYKSRPTCIEPRGAYDAKKDVLFFEDAPDFFFKLQPGQFGIYFPEDVHAPMIGEGQIRKVVMKIKQALK